MKSGQEWSPHWGFYEHDERFRDWVIDKKISEDPKGKMNALNLKDLSEQKPKEFDWGGL